MIKKYYNIAKKTLFPINRSLTGKGILKTLKIIKKAHPRLQIKKHKSGTKAFDWKVPPEWNVTDAYVVDKNGKKIIDFKILNLHLVSYSTPINKILKRDQLFKKLHYLKKQANAIPYVTSFYTKDWGFCVSYNEFKKFKKKYQTKDKFKVVIKSSFKNRGDINYGELLIKGKSKEEIFVSTYICHPSMANNELSGPIVSMGLIDYFKKKKLNKTLRFIFIPETIGSILYLSKNFHQLKENVIGGYNLSCIGDDRQHSCMLSKYENSPSDEALLKAYKLLRIKKFKIYSFLRRGSDERQYNSPGIDLKISSIFRTKYHEYPEYHTSLDNFKVVTIKGLTGGFLVAKKAISILQENIYPKYNILCEPHFIKRKLYPTFSIKNNNKNFIKSYKDFLQFADGTNSLEKISNYINLDIKKVKNIYKNSKKLRLIRN